MMTENKVWERSRIQNPVPNFAEMPESQYRWSSASSLILLPDASIAASRYDGNGRSLTFDRPVLLTGICLEFSGCTAPCCTVCITGDQPEQILWSGTVPACKQNHTLVFSKPVKSSVLHICGIQPESCRAIPGYIPCSPEDFHTMMDEAMTVRQLSSINTGESPDQWSPVFLAAFDAEIEEILLLPRDTAAETEEAAHYLYTMYRMIRRAVLTDPAPLRSEYRMALAYLENAAKGPLPLMYPQNAADDFSRILSQVEAIARQPVCRLGDAQDAEALLETGKAVFLLQRNQPRVRADFRSFSDPELLLCPWGVFSGAGPGEITLEYGTVLPFGGAELEWDGAENHLQIEILTQADRWESVSFRKADSHCLYFDHPISGSAVRFRVETDAHFEIRLLQMILSVRWEDISLRLAHDHMIVGEGTSCSLKAELAPYYLEERTITYTTDSPSLLSVTNKGEITVLGLPEGISQAKASLIVKADAGGQKCCSVEIRSRNVDASEKEPLLIRLKNAEKLLAASDQADYRPGALEAFRLVLADIRNRLLGPMTFGGLSRLEAALQRAILHLKENWLLPERETRRLIDRILGTGSSKRFAVQVIAADAESGRDVFEVDWQDGKPVLRGNNGVSLATAFNYYLKYHLFLDFPYTGRFHLTLPKTLPVPDHPIRIVFPYQYRHYFNENCEYKYTVSYYNETQWQRRIDWLAMNGFNMFLFDLGSHAIWYHAFDALGLSREAGPGTPLQELLEDSRHSKTSVYPKSFQMLQKEEQMAKKVMDMAFRAGLEPEIRPFIGALPFLFPLNHDDYYAEQAKKEFTIHLPGSVFDGMLVYEGNRWMNQPAPLFISPLTAEDHRELQPEMQEKFDRISQIYYDSAMETLGFNRWGKSISCCFADICTEQGFVILHEAFPRSVIGHINRLLLKQNPDIRWLQSSWRYQSWIQEQYPQGNLIFIDLCAENRPKWENTGEFGGTPWIWSMLSNFGGNHGFEGDLMGTCARVLAAKEAGSQMSGVGIAPEGGDTNPAMYALMAETTWRSKAPDMAQWVRKYWSRRYGPEAVSAAGAELEQLWQILCSTVYSGAVPYDGPTQALVMAYPRLSGAKSRTWGSNSMIYETRQLLPAWELMLKAAEKIKSPTEQFRYDVLDITRQILSDVSGELYRKISPAFTSGQDAARYADAMAAIGTDLDRLCATLPEFLLGTRLASARSRGVTDADQAYLEKSERTTLTYWLMDNPIPGGLTDYCNHQFSGLMEDYYVMRWKIFADHLRMAQTEGLFSEADFNRIHGPRIQAEINEKMIAWTGDTAPYPTDPTGDPIAVSGELFRIWAPRLHQMNLL